MPEIQAFNTFQGIGCLISTNRNFAWAGASQAPWVHIPITLSTRFKWNKCIRCWWDVPMKLSNDCHYKSNRPKKIIKTCSKKTVTEHYNNCVFHQTFGQWSFRTNCWTRYTKLGCFFTWSSVLLKLSTRVEITCYASSTNKWGWTSKDNFTESNWSVQIQENYDNKFLNRSHPQAGVQGGIEKGQLVEET